MNSYWMFWIGCPVWCSFKSLIPKLFNLFEEQNVISMCFNNIYYNNKIHFPNFLFESENRDQYS